MICDYVSMKLTLTVTCAGTVCNLTVRERIRSPVNRSSRRADRRDCYNRNDGRGGICQNRSHSGSKGMVTRARWITGSIGSVNAIIVGGIRSKSGGVTSPSWANAGETFKPSNPMIAAKERNFFIFYKKLRNNKSNQKTLPVLYRTIKIIYSKEWV